jgi:predicted MFS family arabinose efflux permease
MSRSLWRHADFLRLWAAQAVSAFGSRITREGLPLAAVLTLDATPAQLGLLAALGYGPGLVVGLFAGGWADRRRRRPLLIGSDLLRALLLLSIPLAAWSGQLAMAQLYVVAALVGAATVVFDIADHAYLPSLVDRDQLMDGNSKLGVTESVAEVGGPALAGVLFQILSAPFALVVNAGTYLASAAFLATIRRRETPPDPEPRGRHPFADLMTGLRAIAAQPLVRPLLAMTVAQGFFGAFFAALYMLFAIQVLRIPPALLGLIIAMGGVGALAGALLARLASARLGPGPAIIAMGGAGALALLLVPAAPRDPVAGPAFLIAAQLIGDAFMVAAIIPAVTLRQSLFPPTILGRTSAVFHVAGGGVMVLGALAGGALGQWLGVRETLWIGAVGVLLGPLIALMSPLRRLRSLT